MSFEQSDWNASGLRRLVTIADGREADGPEDRVVVVRGDVTMSYEPLEFHHRDRRIPLTPKEGELLELVMLRGRASWEAIDKQFHNDVDKAVRAVVIHRIRAKFRECGAPDPLVTIRSWGLKLHADLQGSSGVWIGLRGK